MDTSLPGALVVTATTTTVDDTAGAAAKAQDFAHRVVEFAEVAACVKFFEEKQIDLDKPNATGATVLMTVVARGRVDLVGCVMDRTTNVAATTIPNGTTVLHLAAMASNPHVIKELAGTDERKAKLRAIANACNRNGDTPLMMASVVKNAVAAKILVEYLDASTTPKNATGMTALMCASRLRDEREGPPMANESASIVSLLLAYGADVNAAEFAGRQTALHFALLSNNLMVVEQLLTILDINLTARNKAGHSPLELARKLKLDGLIDAAVESQWQVVEEEAQLLSDQVAQELDNVATAVPAADTAKKPNKKKDKHKKKATAAKSEQAQKVEEAKEEIPVAENGVAEPTGAEGAQAHEPVQSFAATVVELDTDADDWVTATKKKTKRKESVSDELSHAISTKATNASPAANHRSKSKPKPKTKSDKGAKPGSTPEAKVESVATASTEPQTQSKPNLAASPTVTTASKPKSAPWSTGAVQKNSNSSTPPPSAPLAVQAAPVSVVSQSVDSLPSSGNELTYEDVNSIFQRMYPIAGEMDIPVESFLAGAATRDARALLDGLSVSQIEMLQEAHLQAYHYLNERKIELARILEAERLEAQLQLRRRLFEMQ